MIIRAAVSMAHDTPVAVALVSALPAPADADELLKRLTAFFPTHPIMLVAIAKNGFEAYATFQTHRLLGLLQLQKLKFFDIDLDRPPVARTADLPF